MAYEGTSSSVLDPDGWIWVDGVWVKGSPQWGLSILLWNQTHACSKLKHLACLMAACLPRKVPRHTRPQAPWPRTSPNLGMGGGCAKGVGKCALWLWLWPWQPKPCPVRTTARSKSSKSFPFPLTEETHMEGHTSKNLASLPREARPEDSFHNESEKYTWASISASKNVFRKSLKKNQPVCGTQPHPDKRVGPVVGFPPQRLRCLDACLHRTMEKHMQWSKASATTRQWATTSLLVFVSSARLAQVDRKQRSWRTMNVAHKDEGN